jgi:hypothetical protein
MRHQNRSVEVEQLDDGIGDTLVSVDTATGIRPVLEEVVVEEL